MSNVLLLRAPTQPEDRYEVAFTTAGYKTISVPVLETVFTNRDSLREVVETGPAAEELDGVIMTSARSCEAWKAVVGELVSSSTTNTSTGKLSWSSVPFYVVGPATASALKQVDQTHGQTDYTPQVIRGETSGTGEKLAQFIQSQPEGDRPKKLLYLTGDKNRDTVPTILKAVGIELFSLSVYETQGSQTFEQDLQIALDSCSEASRRWWIIHFAPSAADFVMPTLNKHLRPDELTIKTAAIGPVTASFLRDELKINIDVVSAKPVPQELVTAITTHDRG